MRSHHKAENQIINTEESFMYGARLPRQLRDHGDGWTSIVPTRNGKGRECDQLSQTIQLESYLPLQPYTYKQMDYRTQVSLILYCFRSPA